MYSTFDLTEPRGPALSRRRSDASGRAGPSGSWSSRSSPGRACRPAGDREHRPGPDGPASRESAGGGGGPAWDDEAWDRFLVRDSDILVRDSDIFMRHSDILVRHSDV
jgi:hypothetical protein